MSKRKFYFFIFLFVFFLGNNGVAKDNYFDEGKKLFDEKKFPESKFKFEQDIVFNPKNERSYLYLAKIFKQEEKDDLEEQNLNTVILLNPKNEEALFMLIELQLERSNFSKAKELNEKFLLICSKLCNDKSIIAEKIKNLEPKKSTK